ncbi:hypothetical protein [Aeromicrobium duanguangcaii]|uniref:hypothetical protein n=1 Tax=Aeromicrobium duanguangcaii TaxID=2968086 RepID=UPI002016CB4C|nr:hypothetical protein [Aeromicrobium duanguangcaii]MCL3836986.1 hypothetical protein [Aeromicrobium duanguangcaii]
MMSPAFVPAVVSASGCVALMPRYTSDLRSHPDLVLRPLTHPGVGRYIDCLARPETLERATVQTVLAQIRSITTGLTEHPAASQPAPATPSAGRRSW